MNASYCMLIIVSLCCCFVVKGSWEIKSQALDHGTFWHLTDAHVDQNYSRSGNPNDMCHRAAEVYPDNGLYGNFLCDSPLHLLNVTLRTMKTIESNPDFIIWTGDNLPHTRKFDADWDIIFEAVNNITTSLVANFPGIRVFPSIGNHDTFPANVLLPNSSSVYDDYLKKGGWNKIISKEALPSFLNGGYYSEQIRPGLRLISLNTILWYMPNFQTKMLSDPANQFQWFEDVLRNSSRSSEKVYIIGHVPPGFYNRVPKGTTSDPTYHPQYLDVYLKILKKYYHVILGQMFGHLHMDMFQLFQCGTGDFLGSSLLASSVTPWHFLSKENVSLPVNPSVRLMYYSRSDGLLLDYEQYYLNLTEANQKTTKESNLYQLLYKFRDFYDTPDLSTGSLVQVFENLKNDSDLFDNFFTFSTAGKKSVICDESCKVAQLCSIACTSGDEYKYCMENSTSGAEVKCSVANGKSRHSSWLYVIVILLPIALFVLGFFIFCRKRTPLRNGLRYEPFSGF